MFSRLKSKLNLIDKKIYARKCTVDVIDACVARPFLDMNHIQGFTPCQIHLGLYYCNKLVAVMSFTPPRRGIGKSVNNFKVYELVRYCSLQDTVVIGGSGKLLKHFERNYDWTKVYTFADRCWSTGDMYRKLGFACITSKIQPNYWYTKHFNKRYHRLQFQKKLLKNILPNYQEQLNEMDNMKLNGYYVVWDCGTLRFEKENPQHFAEGSKTF